LDAALGLPAHSRITRPMSILDWIVVLAGILAIAGVNWWFLLADRGSAAAAISVGGAQEATIVVQGGYVPAVVRVKAGSPVRLTFDRQEDSGCSEEVVFPTFGIRKFLPAFEKTIIELTPSAGTHDFTCGMGMLRGKLVVEA
jgi:plastocyanin domain-containing protein